MKDIVFNNLGLKLVALLLAIASWFAIRETISFELELPDVPVEFKTAEGWAVQQPVPLLTVAFRGSQEDIRLMDRRFIKALVDLHTNTLAGRTTVQVGLDNIQTTRGVRPIRVTPGSIDVDMYQEKRATTREWKDVPVAVLVKPFASNSVETAKFVDTAPARVKITVRGTAEALETLRKISPKVWVDCIDLDPALTYDLPVQFFTPAGLNISATIEPSTVRVVIKNP